LEIEYRYSAFAHPGKLRLLGFANHAFMGSYRDTLNSPADGMDITKTRAYRTRYGAGLNVEQEITPEIGAFSRIGWNDGLSETWDYTEMDHTLSVGVSLKGALWKRAADELGLGFVTGGISHDHRDYLMAGGSGFMLGGGLSSYTWEKVVEIYYSWGLLSGLSATADFQEVFCPGYDAARGALAVVAARLHFEI
jgi:high affinity Mn2+ porin